MNTFLDIETIPQQPEDEAKAEIAKTIQAPAQMKKQETIDAWHNGDGKYAGEKEKEIEIAYRRTSFDATKGQICSAAWAIGDGEIQHCGAYENNQEKDLLKFMFDSILLAKGKGADPFFIGHFIAGFDLKFIFHRAVILGVKPPFELPFAGWHGKDYFCTQDAWIGKKANPIKMDALAEALGIEGKGDMDGSKVWDAWKAGDFAKVCEYNVDDIRMNREIYKRITFS